MRKENLWKFWMKNKNKIIKRCCAVGILLGMVSLLHMGCGKRYTEEEAFRDREEVVSENRIDLNFAHKDKELEDNIRYYFAIYVREENEWLGEKIHTVKCKPYNKKLGLTITTNGNEWSVGNLYRPAEIFETFSSKKSLIGVSYEEELQKKIYENANWKLEPMRNEYRFWIEDYIITVNESLRGDVKFTKLFDIVDENSGTRLTAYLHAVVDDI